MGILVIDAFIILENRRITVAEIDGRPGELRLRAAQDIDIDQKRNFLADILLFPVAGNRRMCKHRFIQRNFIVLTFFLLRSALSRRLLRSGAAL